jgi:DNA-binding transcriptional LysR family regulator
MSIPFSSRYSTQFDFLPYPQLEISVQSESSSDLAHDLLTADLDVALITDPAKNSKLTINKLVETPLHIVLPSEHSLAARASVKLADLRQ